jgi:ribosomal protein S18 acetylase RimI-like enzyme
MKDGMRHYKCYSKNFVGSSLTGFECAGFQCRSETPEDEVFLFELFCSNRQEELAPTGWDEGAKESFLKMQFRAMRQGYALQHPNGEFLVICRGEYRVGRIVVDRSGAEIRLVDIALRAEERGRGTGTCLMRELQQQANLAMKALRLQVYKGNGASRWYQRLGFVHVLDDGIYETLEWRRAPECPMAQP